MIFPIGRHIGDLELPEKGAKDKLTIIARVWPKDSILQYLKFSFYDGMEVADTITFFGAALTVTPGEPIEHMFKVPHHMFWLPRTLGVKFSTDLGDLESHHMSISFAAPF